MCSSDLSRDTIIVNYSKEVPKIDDKAIFLYPEIPPSFPGGSQALQNYIQNYLEYNTEQFHQGIEGKIQAGFVVHENGNISHIRILKGLNPELDKSVVDLIYKMPKWIPGQISKTNVKVYHFLPVKYKIKTKKIKPPTHKKTEY